MTIVPTFIRSQRDIVGEKEAVRQLIEQTEQQLATVEQKLSGAERDKRNKEEEMNTFSEENRRHRLVCLPVFAMLKC